MSNSQNSLRKIKENNRIEGYERLENPVCKNCWEWNAWAFYSHFKLLGKIISGDQLVYGYPIVFLAGQFAISDFIVLIRTLILYLEYSQ